MWDKILGVLEGELGQPALALFALLGIAAVVIWTVYVFFSKGTQHAAQKYYDLKLQLSIEAAKCTAQMATSINPEIVRAAAIRFEELYWGELVLVEDSPLEIAMVEFRELLARSEENELELEKLIVMSDRTTLRTAALSVSRAGFNLLQPNWFDQIKSVFRTPQKT